MKEKIRRYIKSLTLKECEKNNAIYQEEIKRVSEQLSSVTNDMSELKNTVRLMKSKKRTVEISAPTSETIQ